MQISNNIRCRSFYCFAAEDSPNFLLIQCFAYGNQQRQNEPAESKKTPLFRARAQDRCSVSTYHGYAQVKGVRSWMPFYDFFGFVARCMDKLEGQVDSGFSSHPLPRVQPHIMGLATMHSIPIYLRAFNFNAL